MVSIIIPLFNKETTIQRAINSALNQTYKNCEVIVVDDCSTDESSNICKGFNGKIRFISTDKNEGSSSSREKGRINAKGKYITFLDADDYLDKNAIEQCVICQKRTDADIVQMNIIRRISKFELPITFKSSYNTSKALEACLYNEHLFPVQCWGKLYKYETLKNINHLDYNGFWGDDRIFNLAIMAKSPQIKVVSSARYNYMWGGATSSNFDINTLQEYKQVYQLKCDWANSNGYEEYLPLMQKELVELLKYHIRHLINSKTMSKSEALEYLHIELNQPFWTSFNLLDANKLYETEKKSFNRVIKKQISNLIK